MIEIDYIGLKCGICGKDFEQGDDVVVCPDCGTPAHRECWKSEGKCPNEDKHSEGYVFEGFELIKKSAGGVNRKTEDKGKQSETPARLSEGGARVCPLCGMENSETANFCNRCGSRLTAAARTADKSDSADDYGDLAVPPGFADPLGGVPAQAEFEENVTAADLACYVAVNTPYYLRAFDSIKRKTNRFNFSAAIFSGVWFLYRKQYKLGALIFSLETLLYVLRYYISVTYSVKVINGVLDNLGLSIDNISSFTMEQYMNMSLELQKLPIRQQLIAMMPSLLLIVQIIAMILLGIFANKLYYNHCIKEIRQLKTAAAGESLDKAETAQMLNLSGGVNAFVAGALMLIYLFMLFN